MKKGQKDSPYKYLAMISQIGIMVLVPVVMMTVAGKVIDYYFHTGNMLVIIFAVLGGLAGLRNLYVVPLRMSEQAQKKNAEKLSNEDKPAAVDEQKQMKGSQKDDDENDTDF
ncbi:MAG: AtpZ/AtpI family protein [Eubacteriaceae bacterium]|jgi:F0F1-type ATP synthase assembly protein I